MSLSDTIKSLNESARKVHGSDIYFLVARAKAWGHVDNLVIVQGKNHSLAAADVARVLPGAKIMLEETSDYNGGKKHQSLISF